MKLKLLLLAIAFTALTVQKANGQSLTCTDLGWVSTANGWAIDLGLFDKAQGAVFSVDHLQMSYYSPNVISTSHWYLREKLADPNASKGVIVSFTVREFDLLGGSQTVGAVVTGPDLHIVRIVMPGGASSHYQFNVDIAGNSTAAINITGVCADLIGPDSLQPTEPPIPRYSPSSIERAIP